MNFNILEFKFTGIPPWTFPTVHICLFLVKLVKATYCSSELRCSASEHARVHVPFPIYADGSKSSQGVSCATKFPDFEVFISLPIVALIFAVELCAN